MREDTSVKTWTQEWIKRVDMDALKLYALQFAQCKRMEQNDVVYIFDEVGSGKTISSALMAMSYMENQSKRVLIVTTASNVSTNQFLNDWKEKLHSVIQGHFEGRIDIINNNWKNIGGKNGEQYGLVIIDEAHLFLNMESVTTANLCGIKADKVIIMTATPIKNNAADLLHYQFIANSIIDKQHKYSAMPFDTKEQRIRKTEEVSRDFYRYESSNENDEAYKKLRDELYPMGRSKEDVICSTFDPASPVTRYFKDTVKYLEKTGTGEGYEKVNARRYFPQEWKPVFGEDRAACVARKIDKILQDDKNSRFVVFVRRIKDTKLIGAALEKYHFEECFSTPNEMHDRKYMIITGESKEKLRYVVDDPKATEKRDYVPTVVIFTYQIAEQGLNMSQYNYVVNYHISEYPSVLEQRFGRVDRLNSRFPFIHICYVLGDFLESSDVRNFYSAICRYERVLLSKIPARNVLLTNEILQHCIDATEQIEKYIEDLEKELNEKRVEDLTQLLQEAWRDEWSEEQIEENLEQKEDADSRWMLVLYKMCMECEDYQFEKTMYENDMKSLCNDMQEMIASELKTLKEGIKRDKLESVKNCIDIISSDEKEMKSDSIFYQRSETPGDFAVLRAVHDCGDAIIRSEAFQKFNQEFEHSVKVIVELNRMRKWFEEPISLYLANKFLKNEFDYCLLHMKPFQDDGVTVDDKFKVFWENMLDEMANDPYFIKLFEEHWKGEIAKPKPDNKLKEYFPYLFPFLPFIRLCEEFGKQIRGIAVKYEHFSQNSFCEKNHLMQAYMDTIRSIQDDKLKSMFATQEEGIFGLSVTEDKRLQATPWYKLMWYYGQERMGKYTYWTQTGSYTVNPTVFTYLLFAPSSMYNLSRVERTLLRDDAENCFIYGKSIYRNKVYVTDRWTKKICDSLGKNDSDGYRIFSFRKELLIYVEKMYEELIMQRIGYDECQEKISTWIANECPADERMYIEAYEDDLLYEIPFWRYYKKFRNYLEQKYKRPDGEWKNRERNEGDWAAYMQEGIQYFLSLFGDDNEMNHTFCSDAFKVFCRANQEQLSNAERNSWKMITNLVWMNMEMKGHISRQKLGFYD